MKSLWKTVSAWLLVCQCFFITAYARPDWPSDTGAMAEAGIVIDADTNTVLYGQQMRIPYPPASITKLLTALVVIENGNLDDMVTFSDDAVNNVESGSGNVLSISPGDKMTVRECLYGLLLKSSNQCANALAEHIAGNRDAFVQMMNDKIAALGCTQSHFANPSGLNSDEQIVTAYDMALIAQAAFNNPTLLEIDSSKTAKLPATAKYPEGQTIKMSHRILVTSDTSSPYYCEGAVGGKTGYTSLAGNTLVTYAQRDGRRLISVILKGSQPQYYIDGKALLDFGFARFQNVSIAEQETSYTTGTEAVTVGGHTYQPSDLVLDAASGTNWVTIPKDASFADVQKTLTADLPDGHPERAAAMIQYTYNDRKIGHAYLLLTEEAYAAQNAAAQAESAQTGVPQTESGASTQEGEGTSPKTESQPSPQSGSQAVSASQADGSKPGGTSQGITAVIKAASIGLGVMAVLAFGLAFLLIYRKRQEERERAMRRERRRQRLMEENISEEEFYRMMEEHSMERKSKRI